MFKITVDPRVLVALKNAYPNPINSAARALDKYTKALEKLLFEASLHRQTALQRMQKSYSISLQRLANEGGQIGPQRKRLHAWLRENGLDLVKCVSQGSNLTGKVSEVRITELVTVKDQLLSSPVVQTHLEPDELDSAINTSQGERSQLMHLIYPEMDAGKDVKFDPEKYDSVEVDLQSVRNYIDWLQIKATEMKSEEKRAAIRQAKIILAAASIMDGAYMQKKKPSAFGRMYYEGISVQNVNKQLRSAILGDCWEYDIRSSVIAWKMGFAQDCLVAQDDGSELRKAFWATLNYLEDKPDFMKTVRHFTFEGRHDLSREFQTKLLKTAITAISFGARESVSGWLDSSGHWNNPALVEILKNQQDRKRFLADTTIRQFIKEQNRLDDYLYAGVKSEMPELLKHAQLQTPSGRPSKSKVLAYLYQHQETEVMNIVQAAAASKGRYPLARVHDAIFFRHRLGPDLKSEIEMAMQDKTGNLYWRLAAEQLHRYEPVAGVDQEEEPELSIEVLLKRMGITDVGKTSH